MQKLLTISGGDLSARQLQQLDEAELREFQCLLPPRDELGDRLYFLLVETEANDLLACAYLKPIHPVLFGKEAFSFLNIGGVIANQKGQGYGKQVMVAVRDYLLSKDQTGLGFCFPKNQAFYEKCGFQVEENATDRFIYREGERRFTADGQYILYLESSERMMEKVLAQPEVEVFVPDPGIW